MLKKRMSKCQVHIRAFLSEEHDTLDESKSFRLLIIFILGILLSLLLQNPNMMKILLISTFFAINHTYLKKFVNFTTAISSNTFNSFLSFPLLWIMAPEESRKLLILVLNPTLSYLYNPRIDSTLAVMVLNILVFTLYLKESVSVEMTVGILVLIFNMLKTEKQASTISQPVPEIKKEKTPVHNQNCKDEAELGYLEGHELTSFYSAHSELRSLKNFSITTLLDALNEYRNFLNYANGNIDLANSEVLELEENAKSEKIKTLLKNARSGLYKLNHLITNVIDASKIEMNNLEFNPFPVSIKFICEKLWILIADSIQEKNLGASLILGKAFPNMITVDSHRLIQLLYNIIKYILHQQNQGSIRIYVNFVPSVSESIVHDKIMAPISEDTSLAESLIIEEKEINIEEQPRTNSSDNLAKFTGNDTGVDELSETISHMNFNELISKKTMDSLNASEGSQLTRYILTLEDRTFPEQLHLPKTVSNSSEGKVRIKIQSIGGHKDTSNRIVESLKHFLNHPENNDLNLFVAHHILKGIDGIVDIDTISDSDFSINLQISTRVPFQPRSLMEQPSPLLPANRRKISVSLMNLDNELLNVVVVDDVQYNREVNKRFLEKCGANVIAECSNGIEAVKYYKEHYKKIDAITMDIEMPLMDGKEASALIREFEDANNLKPVKIAMITGNVSQKEECLSLTGKVRADFFLRKPTSFLEFKDLIDKMKKDLKSGQTAILCGVFGQELEAIRHELESNYSKFISVNSVSEIINWLSNRNMKISLICLNSKNETKGMENVIRDLRKYIKENNLTTELAYINREAYKLQHL